MLFVTTYLTYLTTQQQAQFYRVLQ